MGARKVDRADVVLRMAWLKAWREGRLEVRLPSETGAERTRFALYRAVQEAREGRAGTDLELQEAANGVMLSKSGSTLVLQRRDTLAEIAVVAAAVGQTVEDFESQLEREGRESAERLLRRLKEGDGS